MENCCEVFPQQSQMFRLHSFERGGRRILIALFNGESSLCTDSKVHYRIPPEDSANVTASVLSLGSHGTNLRNIMHVVKSQSGVCFTKHYLKAEHVFKGAGALIFIFPLFLVS